MKRSPQEQTLITMLRCMVPETRVVDIIATLTDQCPECGEDIPAGQKECLSLQCVADQGDQWWDDLPNRPWNVQ